MLEEESDQTEVHTAKFTEEEVGIRAGEAEGHVTKAEEAKRRRMKHPRRARSRAQTKGDHARKASAALHHDALKKDPADRRNPEGDPAGHRDLEDDPAGRPNLEDDEADHRNLESVRVGRRSLEDAITKVIEASVVEGVVLEDILARAHVVGSALSCITALLEVPGQPYLRNGNLEVKERSDLNRRK